MDDLEKRSSSDLQSESWSTSTVYDTAYERDNTGNDLESENWSTSSVYDAVYEKDNTMNEAAVEVQGDTVEENENSIKEEVADEYDGDYLEYMPRYATYSNKSESIMQKFLKKKMLVILVLLAVCTVGIVIGLSVHFTQPRTTLVAPTTTVSRTTTVIPIEIASVRDPTKIITTTTAALTTISTTLTSTTTPTTNILTTSRPETTTSSTANGFNITKILETRECNPGFFDNGVDCTDINECKNGQNDCHAHATCSNTSGSYSCTCDVGYEGDGIQCSVIAVLVLSTLKPTNRPMLVSSVGLVDDNLDFDYGNEGSIAMGCAVTLRDQMWYLGGDGAYLRQKSKIVGCQKVRQDDLPFDFVYGSCNTFSAPEEKALLCFSLNNRKGCHLFDGENFETVMSSKCDHEFTFGLVNYRGSPLTTGSEFNSDCFLKTEVYNFETSRWNDAPDYPYSSSNRQSHYAVASTDQAAFVIGGRHGHSVSSVIAKYENDEWSLHGNLKKSRAGHMSITFGTQTMVIGGYTDDGSAVETEIWNFTGDDNRIVNPTLPNGHYRFGGLYRVPAGFCSVKKLSVP